MVFTEIYSNHLWRGEARTLCSGAGSREQAVVEPYLACMKHELQRLGAGSMTAVDLGCRDFMIGRQLAPNCGRYVGVDVVRDLIAYNHANFSNEQVTFRHIDIVDDELPDGDICFVRQVLQHLSNEQIQKVLPKLAKYKQSYITEHQPSPGTDCLQNADKPHGADIRLNQGSGLFLEAPPFDVDPRTLRLILEVSGHSDQDGRDPGVIRTFALGAQAQ